ncbi:outer membrane autotransporter barrel domain protein 7 [Achromobacter xylosoxidans A8]|uniref:Outer membrane autotransporter barrel domain protein 7 n=1 Tax=Achromobacter xylosoxidans (strain A8) TaxID=762376 RepID=E3HKB6_ACHXA|nr:autotransporter outer membrane beta-barrel domain-containing protein [Achromobacter xylosoxidans]ADP18071.1 outer membrane autotransporter barrel domain protein 7 [Achromobacter xylosoxidans A8]
MVARYCLRTGWLKSAVLVFYAANFAYPANAQSVSSSGQIDPGPVQTPHWTVGGDLTVGDTLAGELVIDAGGSVVNDLAYIGNFNGGIGAVTVSGRDGNGVASTWTSLGSVQLGLDTGASGTVTIRDGGSAQSDSASIGFETGGVGNVLVSGPGSTWNLSTGNAFVIGGRGQGSLRIDHGGAVHSGQAILGWEVGSEGSATVSGAATVWDPLNNIYVGLDGKGELHVQDGASVSTVGSTAPGAAATVYIGRGVDGVGTVTVSSATADVSTLAASDRIEIGSAGTGTLTIEKGGKAIAAADTWLTVAASATGTLNLTGDASGRGVLETGSVIKGAGNATFNLDGGILRANRNEANFLKGFSTQAVGSGGAGFDTNGHEVGVTTAFSGTSRLNKLGAGTLTLSGNSAAFTGNTDVQAGTLQVDGILGGPVTVLAAARLTGTGRVGATVNRGTIAPGPRSGFGTLTIAGDYAAQGGNLEIRTQLGADDSPTDKLVITGDSAGSTPVTVKNMGGAGAQTQRGIQVVQVYGLSAGKFDLANGDYVIGGRPALVAGAYGYVLQQDPADGGWYLRSSLTNPVTTPTDPGTTPTDPGTTPTDPGTTPTNPGTPSPGGGSPGAEPPLLYQPGVPVYEAYANTLLHLSQLPTLRQRVGNRLYDPADAGRNGVWSRVEGTTGRLDPAASTTGARQNVDSWKAQFGVDRILAGKEEGSRLVGGLAFHYGKADSRVSSVYGNGTIDTTSYGLTPTLTWYGKNGLYIDTQAQATWFDSDLNSGLAGKLKGGQKAQSYGLGIEAGKAFGLSEELALIPQAQLTYVSTRFDSFNDKFGARVESDKGDSLLGRFGIALDYKRNWQTAGAKRESSVYGVVNVKHEFLDGTSVRVAGVPAASRMARTWGSIGAGANFGWGERYAIYGQVEADADFSGSYIVTATAGFRMAF